MISHLQEVLRLYRATCWSIVWKFHFLRCGCQGKWDKAIKECKAFVSTQHQHYPQPPS
jgi:hypothetical protein